MKDKLMLAVAGLIVVIGFGSFYYFGDLAGPAKLGILLLSLIIAAVVFYQTPTGKSAWEFTKGSRQELRKVVWPNRRETTQVTLIVFVMAVLVAVFLWVVDWGLAKILSAVTT